MIWLYGIGFLLFWIGSSYFMIKEDYIKNKKRYRYSDDYEIKMGDAMTLVAICLVMSIIWFAALPAFIIGFSIKKILERT